MKINELHKLMLIVGITVTKHARQRMVERNIKIADIRNAILTGEIIEDYPNRKPYQACLILGNDTVGNPLHVIVASDEKHLKLVTSYYPDQKHFEDDNQTRK